jgi:adenosylmethionine-8-amino-7-oxononanoate aminotransferase
MIDKDKKFVWHPFTPQHPTIGDNIFIEKAEGIYLHTSDGRKIIDALRGGSISMDMRINVLLKPYGSKQVNLNM